MKSKVSFIKPDFPTSDEMLEDYAEIVASNWYTNFGPFERKLCREVAEYIGQDVAVTTVANATLGLDIAVRALLTKHDGEANEVIMPSFTFAAGPEVLLSSGYTPVFIDIEESNWQPSLAQAKTYLAQNEHKVRGILLCNIFGVGNGEIQAWEELAAQYSLPLIIDSAAGFGSLYEDGSPIGARGDCEVFSMHATKPFSVGEGGLIVSRDAELIKTCRSLQNFGFVDYEIKFIGTNAKLQEINCAIGCRQLTKLDNHLASRREVLQKFKDLFAGQGFSYQANDDNSTVPFLSVVIDTEERAIAVKAALRDENIEARSYYAPLHLQTHLQPLTVNAESLATTEAIASRILSLPVHDDMSSSLIERVATTVTSV